MKSNRGCSRNLIDVWTFFLFDLIPRGDLCFLFAAKTGFLTFSTIISLRAPRLKALNNLCFLISPKGVRKVNTRGLSWFYRKMKQLCVCARDICQTVKSLEGLGVFRKKKGGWIDKSSGSKLARTSQPGAYLYGEMAGKYVKIYWSETAITQKVGCFEWSFYWYFIPRSHIWDFYYYYL